MQRKSNPSSTNPEANHEIQDGPDALRVSPGASGVDEKTNVPTKPAKKGQSKAKQINGATVNGTNSVDGPEQPAINGEDGAGDRGEGGQEAADLVEIMEALVRPPPVNSDYLPLPWKGRIGYACLNTYLRSANTPIFSSRTCRIASILEHRHPLKNPDEPEHATKNRSDKDKPAEIWRGQKYVEELGLANARDIPKMVRWNDRYGIKFMRLSSEMFPFASHEEYGYKLAPFAAEMLAEAGRVAGELGHRLTTHPGQVSLMNSR